MKNRAGNASARHSTGRTGFSAVVFFLETNFEIYSWVLCTIMVDFWLILARFGDAFWVTTDKLLRFSIWASISFLDYYFNTASCSVSPGDHGRGRFNFQFGAFQKLQAGIKLDKNRLARTYRLYLYFLWMLTCRCMDGMGRYAYCKYAAVAVSLVFSSYVFSPLSSTAVRFGPLQKGIYILHLWAMTMAIAPNLP